MRRLLGAAALCVAACGAGEQDAADADADWIDGVVAEAAEATPPAEWIEVPLADGVFRAPASAYRTDVVEIDVPALGGALEYKLAMKEGGVLAYAWDAGALAAPELFLSEFHGHTERVGDSPGTVMFYRRAVGGSEQGALVAPFDGVHGWYFRNDSDQPVVVRLELSGFYELIEGGE